MTAPIQQSGYNAQADIVQVTADGRDLNSLWAEIQAVLDIFNGQRQQLVNIMTFPVTSLIEDVAQVGEAEFEMASEMGIPESVRQRITVFSLAYDFRDYDTRTAFTWKFLRDADARQVEAIHQSVLTADNRLVFRKVMEALFDNRNRAADIRGQNYTVYALYNGDGTIPPQYKNTTFLGTHTHYMISGAALVDSGDLEALYDNVAEHGYGLDNGTDFVVLAGRALVKEIRKFRAGIVNNNGVVANFDFVPSPGQPTIIVPNPQGLIGELPPTTFNGLSVVGSYGGMFIVEEDYIPANYLLLLGSGGAGNLQNPVGLREHANAAYRGLRILPGNQQRYPLIDSYYSRGFGTGIRQRAGAAIMQIKASGSYDIPVNYTRGGGLT